MKVLNLYAGIGGNRKLWEDVDVTAVEINPEIAKVYQDYFPDDKVIVGDAHQYLLDHFKEFDFIWSSPPCPTHSKFRYMTTKINPERFDYNNGMIRDIKYADMTLYQEIILLDNYFDGKWVVENVNPYYEPLIIPQRAGRHLFWTNFKIGNFETEPLKIKETKVSDDRYGFDLSKYKMKHRKDQILRNCVDVNLGLYILNCARNIITKQNEKQISLFDE